MRKRHQIARLGHGLTVIGVLVMVFGLMAPTATADPPPGNNGTVKVDGGDLAGQSEVPHVGCDFYIEWFGFDPAATSTVLFEMQAGTDTPKTEGAATSVTYGPFTLDQSGELAKTFNIFDLLKNFSPHAKQGYHVKLTVDTTGSQGNDSKHKVFWVKGCQEKVGSVTLDKLVTGDAAPTNDPTFEFTITSDDPDAVLTTPVSIKASDDPKVVATNVSFGSTVTITETTDNDASSISAKVGTDPPLTGNSVDVAVGDETPVGVVFTNRFDPAPVGSVTLDKVLAGAAPTDDPAFEFTVTSNDPDAVVTSPVSIKASDDAKVVASNVAVGSKVTITETEANGATGTSFTVGAGPPQEVSQVEVTVSSTDAVAVVATNTFTAQVLNTTTTRPDEVLGEELARTGRNSALLLLIGAAFVAGGLMFVLASRRYEAAR